MDKKSKRNFLRPQAVAPIRDLADHTFEFFFIFEGQYLERPELVNTTIILKNKEALNWANTSALYLFEAFNSHKLLPGR